jgi:hypothetical protein
MRPSVNRARPYGAREAKVFLDKVLPAAPDVPIQIAHLAGAGGFDDPSVDSALSVFVTAIANRDARMAHVYFDVCGVAGIGHWKEKKNLIAERIREIGVSRILWGSDGAFGAGVTPAQALAAYRGAAFDQTGVPHNRHESSPICGDRNSMPCCNPISYLRMSGRVAHSSSFWQVGQLND